MLVFASLGSAPETGWGWWRGYSGSGGDWGRGYPQLGGDQGWMWIGVGVPQLDLHWSGGTPAQFALGWGCLTLVGIRVGVPQLDLDGVGVPQLDRA